MLLHLVADADWRAVVSSGADRYAPPSLAGEGFVHCTAGDEVLLAVANARYRDDARPFVVLTLDPARLGAEVRWEAPPGADPLAARVARFPHVYGPIEVAAVVAVRPVRRGADGTFVGYGPPATPIDG